MISESWPALPLNEWKETYATLHMWTQIVGKIRLVQTPLLNHYWNCTLYVTPRGLTTSSIPYGDRLFSLDFDLIDHLLMIQVSNGAVKIIPLRPQPTADFYRTLMETLAGLGIDVKIHPTPDEVADPIPFDQDDVHASYDKEYVDRFRRILQAVDTVFKEFRAQFIGKCSPVHFFWGSFDLAVTRFSGRPAPERQGADAITREAYSHEVISHGFWPGSGAIQQPAFYSYTAPQPSGLAQETIRPHSAFYSQEMSEFILMYNDIRKESSPADPLLEFMQSTYEAGAKTAGWDRAALERK